MTQRVEKQSEMELLLRRRLNETMETENMLKDSDERLDAEMDYLLTIDPPTVVSKVKKSLRAFKLLLLTIF